jgi:hypothetical protein
MQRGWQAVALRCVVRELHERLACDTVGMAIDPRPPLAMQVPPRPRTGGDLEQEIQRIRNRMRKYSALSIVKAALTELAHDHGSPLENLRAAPWITLLLVKWALQDRMVYMDIGPAIPRAVFDQLRQQVWSLPQFIQRPRNAMGLMRTVLQQQLEFQRPHGFGFLRWAALIARRPAGDALFQRFCQTMGMDPNTYIDLAWAMYVNIINGERVVADSFFEPLRPAYGAAVDQMLNLFVRTVPALRDELHRPGAAAVRGRNELLEFPWMRRFPFVRLHPGAILCWHPLVLARGLEDAVHLRLSDYGEQYTRPFSRIFESYVTEVAMQAAPHAVSEDAYQRALGSEAPKVEALVQEDGCNILIEAKMALFADSVLVTDDPTTVYQKTKRVDDAIDQGWKVSAALGKPAHPMHRQGLEENYLLVVTSRQLHLGRGSMLAELYPPGRLAYPDQGAERRLPLSHVFILSIEEFEQAMGCVRAGEVTLSALVRRAAAENEEPATMKLYFADHLGHFTRQFQRTPLLNEATELAIQRLAKVLPPS